MGEGLVSLAVLLRCPNCGNDLPGLDDDRAWACPPCARAWEVEDGRLAERPYRAWRVPAEGEGVWLPFWRIAYEPRVAGSDARAVAAVESATASRRAWVRAFRLDGAFSIGDPGQSITSLDAPEVLDARDLPVCAGTRIGSAEAAQLARLFALAAADRIADVTPVTLDLDVRELMLVAVPFVDAGRDLVCPVDGRPLQKRTFPDLVAIAAA
jgi:hypothetical protein